MNDWLTPLSTSSATSWILAAPLFSLWRIIASLLVLLLGVFVAGRVTSWLRQLARRATSNPAIKDSPVSAMWETTEGLKGTGVVSTLVFWLVMTLFIAWAGELLGIQFFSDIVAAILLLIPRLLSAAIVLVLGIVLAGVGERVIKQQAKRFAPQQAVLAGTFFSYGIMILFSLMAVSELGIASNFILLLFAGCVFALALAAGLALGLGAKDLVSESLRSMVNDENLRREVGLVEPTAKKRTPKAE